MSLCVTSAEFHFSYVENQNPFKPTQNTVQELGHSDADKSQKLMRHWVTRRQSRLLY